MDISGIYIAHRLLMHNIEILKKNHFKYHNEPENKERIFIPIFYTNISIYNIIPLYYLFGFNTTHLIYSSLLYVISILIYPKMYWEGLVGYDPSQYILNPW